MPHLPLSRALLALLPLFFAACPTPVEPDDPQQPPPSFEVCDALTTQRECFAAGCHYFTTTNALVPDAADAGSCQLGAGTSACLFSPQGIVEDDTLTFYRRVDADGAMRTLQLNADVTLSGWQRCGYTSLPPDCDCDGAP